MQKLLAAKRRLKSRRWPGTIPPNRLCRAKKRYKGLGEMDAEQLFETTMNPEKRVLVQVKVADAEKADAIFNKLMGNRVDLRKSFIQANAKFVKIWIFNMADQDRQSHQTKSR